jgi:ATP diphosphatase
MARLRDPDRGCEWDRVQTSQSIAPYTLEEAYEVHDAIIRHDDNDLRDELGDLLLQVIFHSQMASERGAFTLGDVIAAICAKMERRHPHIFGDANERADWETMKAQERGQKAQSSQLDGIALALPALSRAEKIQKRAARVGFDWPDVGGAMAKVEEELAELAAANTSAEREDEFGDVLFALVNAARHYGIDPEQALMQANEKFSRRFRHMEQQAAEGLQALDLDALEALWQQAKSATKQA